MSYTVHSHSQARMSLNERHRTDRFRNRGYSGRSSTDVIAAWAATLAGNGADDSTDEKETP
jgi:hypothetical protein